MGFRFHTKTANNEKGPTYFFSFRDLQNFAEESAGKNAPPEHLSLGANFSDWYSGTSDLVKSLYRDLCADAPQIWAHCSEPTERTIREAKILTGNLSLYVSQRLARSIAQLERLPPALTLDIQNSELPTRLVISGSDSTKAAIQTVRSEQFDELVDLLATNYKFGFASSISVEIGPNSFEENQVSSIAGRLYLKVASIISRLSQRNQVSISSSYLGRITEQLLQVSLRQWPALTELRPPTSPPNLPRRETRVEVSGTASLRQIAFSLLTSLAPTSLVGDFSKTLSAAYDNGFSRSPLVVFTANSFEADDQFKAHLVAALPKAKYVVAQHGVGYGVSLTRSLCPEQEASDLFLSWGWGESSEKVHPVGMIKKKIIPRHKRLRGVTLFLRPEKFMYHLCADMGEPNEHYFSAILKLCRELDELGVDTRVRVHHTTPKPIKAKLGWEIRNYPSVSLDDAGKSMSSLLASGQGIVFTYDSTGMLELATSGVPFFSFMPEGLELINPKFMPNYKALSMAGLLSEEPSSSAAMISTWLRRGQSSERHYSHALMDFCRGLAFRPRSRVGSLRSLLRLASRSFPAAHENAQS